MQCDAVLRQAFEEILDSPVSDSQWSQVTLSFDQGGLGLLSPLIQAPAASTAGLIAWVQSPPSMKIPMATTGLSGTRETLQWLLAELGNAEPTLKDWLDKGVISPSDKDDISQKEWSTLQHKARRASLLQDANSRDSIRLRCQSSSGCFSWSRAPPSFALGTKIPTEKYRIMLKWHLGMPVL